MESQTLWGCVYRITNTENGMQYIGQTRRSPQVRWSEHLRQNCVSAGWFLNRAMREFESRVWEFTIIKNIVLDIDDHDVVSLDQAKDHLKNLLLQEELVEIQRYAPHSLYNMSKTATRQCEFEDCQFASGTCFGMTLHCWSVHEAPAWTECQQCVNRFRDSSTQRSTGFAHWCSDCWLTFKTNYFQYICHTCHKSFLWKAGLDKHTDREHPLEKINLSSQVMLAYQQVCSQVINNRSIGNHSKNVYRKIWLKCGRQIAGKISPQVFHRTFYF